jgi:hypothetical protein
MWVINLSLSQDDLLGPDLVVKRIKHTPIKSNHYIIRLSISEYSLKERVFSGRKSVAHTPIHLAKYSRIDEPYISPRLVASARCGKLISLSQVSTVRSCQQSNGFAEFTKRVYIQVCRYLETE